MMRLGSPHRAGRFALAMAGLQSVPAFGQRTLDSRHGLHQVDHVIGLQSVCGGVGAFAVSGGLPFGWLHAANDDVATAQFANGFLSLVAGAFANGQHGDH